MFYQNITWHVEAQLEMLWGAWVIATPQAINCTLPPAAVVLTVMVCSAQKRYK